MRICRDCGTDRACLECSWIVEADDQAASKFENERAFTVTLHEADAVLLRDSGQGL